MVRREPAVQKQRKRRRFHQAAPQIVENLPPRYQRDRVGHLRSRLVGHRIGQPLHDLPVAAQPAVFAPTVRAVVRRIVLNHRDVAGQPRPRIRSFNQVMAQQRISREASVQNTDHRVDFVDSLPGKRSLAIKILIHIGDRPRIRVEPGFSCKDGGQPRLGRALHTDVDARLHDPISRYHEILLGIDNRLIERMSQRSDHPVSRAAGQFRVGIQRDHEANRRQDREIPDLHRKAVEPSAQ